MAKYTLVITGSIPVDCDMEAVPRTPAALYAMFQGCVIDLALLDEVVLTLRPGWLSKYTHDEKEVDTL